MDVKLVIERGRTRTRVVRLSSPETIVGRQRGCTVRIPSAEVSRRHCRLRQEDGYVTVEDLRSVNGTYLNGMRVVNREIVRPGDHLEIGPVRFVVEYELTPDALDRLSQMSAPAYVEPVEAVEEAVEADEQVLDVAEVAGEQSGEALELVDNEADLAPAQQAKPRPAAAPDFELGDAEQWYLPPADELRDILSQLDDSGPPQQKRR
jgi:pSer/pThr/pTyr-binding forkhead associated (FHA) protein